MNIRQALNNAIKILKNAKKESPALDAGVILCFLLGWEKEYLLTHYDYEICDEKVQEYLNLVNLRAQGVPLQYITGNCEFMSLMFNVNPAVLIPRPETEILVEAVLDYVNKQVIEYPRILDMGTGSGCIAVSLAYYIKNCFVTAVDISENALEIAYSNALKNGVADKIDFICSNLFEKLYDKPGTLSSLDIIVSNPPYISSSEIETLQTEVKDHEPIIALDGGKDGLYYYKKITEAAPAFLKKGGLLAFEVGYNQASAVRKIMEKHFEDINIIKDLAGINRVVVGRK